MDSKLKAGSKAPAINLPTDGNGAFSLKEHKGHPVVVYFYPKDDTSGCTKEAVSFTEHKPEFDKLGVRIVGISPDEPSKHDKFKAKHSLGITLASDTEKEVSEAYGVWVEKSMYGRKYMGVERSTFLIDGTGKIVEVWRKVKVPGHVEAVLEATRKL